jgi:hypothetical protein
MQYIHNREFVTTIAQLIISICQLQYIFRRCHYYHESGLKQKNAIMADYFNNFQFGGSICSGKSLFVVLVEILC